MPKTFRLPRGQEVNLANIMTLTRGFVILPLAPYMFLFAIQSGKVWSIVIGLTFLALAATDLVDGWLARRHLWTSVYGRQLDRGIDKVFAFYSFFWEGVAFFSHITWSSVIPFLVLVAIRAGQDYQSNVLNSTHPSLSSNLPAKIKTWLDDGAIASGYFLLLVAHQTNLNAKWAPFAGSAFLVAAATCCQISLHKKRRKWKSMP